MEGLEVATPLLKPYVVPLTILVLAGFVGRSRAPAASGTPYEKGG